MAMSTIISACKVRIRVGGLYQRLLRSSSNSCSNVIVEQHNNSAILPKTSSSNTNMSAAAVTFAGTTATLSSDTKLVDDLLERTLLLVAPTTTTNLVAFSGGVDSSLVAYLVHRTTTSSGYLQQQKDMVLVNHPMAVLGISPAVPEEQIEMAQEVASWIGIELVKVYTEEGNDPTYIANVGQACLACKTHLYQALNSVAHLAANMKGTQQQKATKLFNGTNADDKQDKTRVGLLAAMQFEVQSPLEFLTKDEVRRASRAVGLPNWNYAASPCLRSRLALGVEATAHHLKLMERAERFVRSYLHVSLVQTYISPSTINLRVRFLANHRAAIELDEHILSTQIQVAATTSLSGMRIASVQDALLTDYRIQDFFTNDLGFHEYIVRPFKSGSVSTRIASANSNNAVSYQ